MLKLDESFWGKKYQNEDYGWDIGYPSTPLKKYIDQLEDKILKILVPGAGNAYEVEYLFEQGYKNVSLIDFAETPIDNFKKRLPNFPHNQIFKEDFFAHKENTTSLLSKHFSHLFPEVSELIMRRKCTNYWKQVANFQAFYLIMNSTLIIPLLVEQKKSI